MRNFLDNLLIASIGFNIWFATNMQIINGALQTTVLLLTITGLIINTVKNLKNIKK